MLHEIPANLFTQDRAPQPNFSNICKIRNFLIWIKSHVQRYVYTANFMQEKQS